MSAGNKILVFGGGCGAKKYLEALLFKFQKEEIILTSFDITGRTRQTATGLSLNYNNFSELPSDLRLIIISVKPEHIYNVLYCISEKINNVPIVLDKPLAINYESACRIEQLCRNKKIRLYVAYNARFYSYSFNSNDLFSTIPNHIELPLRNSKQPRDCLKLDISHVLDFLMYLENNTDLIFQNLHITDRIVIYGGINNKYFHIHLGSKFETRKLNGNVFAVPTIISNLRIVESAIKGSLEWNNFQSNKSIALFLEKTLESYDEKKK